MKLTISKETLLEQLTHVVGAVEKKHTSKILENILIQATESSLKLVGTDLEIEMSSQFPIQSEIGGQITAPARKLFEICKALPAECSVIFETENDRLHKRCS